MQKLFIIWIIISLVFIVRLEAQNSITNAFDDLKRKGTVNSQESEMNRFASAEDLSNLLSEHPVCGYFCFTEDRLHDIRFCSFVPQHWIKRPAETRRQFRGECSPGEFFTWQIGIYAPYRPLEEVSIRFSDLVNDNGDKIESRAIQCFNLEGTNPNGKSFRRTLNVTQGYVQPLWIGMDIPETAQGLYQGKAVLKEKNRYPVEIKIILNITGSPVENHGDNEGWRKTRLHWLNSILGQDDLPTRPYTPLKVREQEISWMGTSLKLGKSGLPEQIETHYNQNGLLDTTITNRILTHPLSFILETTNGQETLKGGKLQIINHTPAQVCWESRSRNKNFEVLCSGTFGFDGIGDVQIRVKARKDIRVKDIRLEIPYSAYASKYLMGLGHKGGFRPDTLIDWHWDTARHQDKIWMGNVDAGLNFRFRDNNYVRPLVNIYYNLGKLNLPVSWGNENKGGIRIDPLKTETILLTAYSGERQMNKNDTLYYNFDMQVTPVKPIDLRRHTRDRFYHSNSDLSSGYLPAALKAGANFINIHHKKDIYLFINYPYYDDSVDDLKSFIDKAHRQNIGVRLYYTTRELTVKIPELWAFRSLGSEVIHDGPGKDTRTLIHKNGPHEWLNKNLTTHFIPAWYNAFKEGKYAGDMDISVITTPDSRWNNYYLAGLDWMVKKLGIDGIYIDDSALDRQTLQRARRILDQDGKYRLIDIHSWNHMNRWAGYANSLHLYLELLPYVDRIWIGEGFKADNTPDFWLVEMSGIPFGLLSETLDAKNVYRGMIFGMPPRLPWSGNPVPLWQLWDSFGIDRAVMKGFWDEQCPVKMDNPNLLTTVYTQDNQALIVIANWTDRPQSGNIILDEQRLGFRPVTATVPAIKGLQSEKTIRLQAPIEIAGRGGWIIWLKN